MSTVFVLSAFNLSGDAIAEPKRLTALPIRIGRNGLNDFVIAHGVVSSFHARVDDVDGRLCVTDLASKNGVRMVGNNSIPEAVPAISLSIYSPLGFNFSWVFTCEYRSPLMNYVNP